MANLKQSMKEILEVFYENNIRADLILHLGTQCFTQPDECCWSYAAKDVFDDEPDEVWEAIGLDIPEHSGLDAISEYLVDNNKLGFLVRFATPVPHHITQNGYSYSWGRYTTKFVYGETYEVACRKAIDWKKVYIAKKKAKAKLRGEEEQ